MEQEFKDWMKEIDEKKNRVIDEPEPLGENQCPIEWMSYVINWWKTKRTIEQYMTDFDELWVWSKVHGWEYAKNIHPNMGWHLLCDEARENLEKLHGIEE